MKHALGLWYRGKGMLVCTMQGNLRGWDLLEGSRITVVNHPTQPLNHDFQLPLEMLR